MPTDFRFWISPWSCSLSDGAAGLIGALYGRRCSNWNAAPCGLPQRRGFGPLVSPPMGLGGRRVPSEVVPSHVVPSWFSATSWSTARKSSRFPSISLMFGRTTNSRCRRGSWLRPPLQTGLDQLAHGLRARHASADGAPMRETDRGAASSFSRPCSAGDGHVRQAPNPRSRRSRRQLRALAKADSILLSSWESAAPLMVCGRRSALSRALYAGGKVLSCSAMTFGS
jgi:hypothetical protein